MSVLQIESKSRGIFSRKYPVFIILLVLSVYTSPQQTGNSRRPDASLVAANPTGISRELLEREQVRKRAMRSDELAWEQTLEANLGDFYLPRYYEDKDTHRETAWDYVKDDPRLPRVLILGDSVSRGYTLPVRHALAGWANVHRAPANCGATAYGIKQLDVWLGTGKWNVITWNFGIHDRSTESAVYRKNLELLAERLERTGATILWVRTTPPPPSGKSQEGYTLEEWERVNTIADDVMHAYKIPEIDLSGLVRPKLAQLQLPDNVHFTDDGYELLGLEVAKEILMAVTSQQSGASVRPN